MIASTSLSCFTCSSTRMWMRWIRKSDQMHQYDAGQGAIIPVKGAGGVSSTRSELEGAYAWSWARNIWADMLG